MSLRCSTRGDAIEFAVKVVPGSARDRICGLLGDSLKVQVSAPPEGGAANTRVCELLAAALQLPVRSLTVAVGTTSPRKVVTALGIDAATLHQRLGLG